MGTNFKEGNSMLFMQLLMTALLLSVTMGIGIVNYGDMYSIQVAQSSFQGYFSSYTFTSLIVTGTAMAVQPVVTANYSAGKIDRVKTVRNYGFGISLV